MNPVLELIAIRSYIPASDEGFLFSTALHGIYYGSEYFKKIKKSIFIKGYRNYLSYVLRRPDASVKVACIKDDITEIKGYAVFVNNEKTLLWVFVKKDWRKNGIASALVPKTITEVLNLTDVGESILKKYPDVNFNPFL